MRFLSRTYRCITFNHRGYPPSAVPEDSNAYSQDNMIEDLAGLARHLGIPQAHWIGCSMGAQGVLMLSMRYPDLCRSTTVVGCGSGSVNHEEFMASSEEHARGLQARGVEYLQEYVAGQLSRRAYQFKDPRGYEEFRRQLYLRDIAPNQFQIITTCPS